jgi:putative transposase
MDSGYHVKGRCKFLLKYHVILVVKYRKQLLTTVGNCLKRFLVRLEKKFVIETMEIDKDHLHLLIDCVPAISIAQIIRFLKQRTTLFLWQEYEHLLSKNFLERTNILVRWLFCMFGR